MFINFEEDKTKKKIAKDFVKNGYIIGNIKNNPNFATLNKKIFEHFKFCIKIKKDVDQNTLFNNLHKYVAKEKLNQTRMKIISLLNKNLDIKKNIYFCVKNYLDEIVGNELAIQKTLNLSIQFPNDKSSLLDIHADTFSGESPFQVVVWLPLVNVYKTKSMFILPLKQSEEAIKKLSNYESKGFEAIYQKYKKHIKWLKIDHGQVLIFSPNLLHGNIINKTTENRISLNIRFKSLFSPYNNVQGNDRKIGYFYFPLNIKPASKLGLKFQYPKFKK